MADSHVFYLLLAINELRYLSSSTQVTRFYRVVRVEKTATDVQGLSLYVYEFAIAVTVAKINPNDTVPLPANNVFRPFIRVRWIVESQGIDRIISQN